MTTSRFDHGVKHTLKIGMIFGALMHVVSAPSFAGEADIVAVDWSRSNDGLVTISATILHADEGWDHYADGFDVLDKNGEILSTRVLAHPHVNEQPFTRQLNGFEVPEGVCQLTISAHDSVHENGGAVMTIDICTNSDQ